MNHTKPLITVVLPCYNVEKHIHRGLDSLLSQTLSLWNAILIDDGSTDNTGLICDEYEKNDSRFTVIHTSNKGVSAARNEGIRRATGELLYFMDPDDYIHNNCLERCYSAYKNCSVDIIKFNYRSEWEDGTESWVMNGQCKDGIYTHEQIINHILPGYIGSSIKDVSMWGTPDFWRNREYGAVWRMAYRLQFIKDNNLLFNEDVKLNEDGMFNCHAIYKANKISVISDVLYCYSIRNAGAMSKLIDNIPNLYRTKTLFLQCREDIQQQSLHNDGIDLFPLYAGSLFLSAVELTIKGATHLSNYTFVRQYIHHNSVKRAIQVIPLKGDIRIKMSLFALKVGFARLMFYACWLLRKLHLLLNKL